MVSEANWGRVRELSEPLVHVTSNLPPLCGFLGAINHILQRKIAAKVKGDNDRKAVRIIKRLHDELSVGPGCFNPYGGDAAKRGEAGESILG